MEKEWISNPSTSTPSPCFNEPPSTFWVTKIHGLGSQDLGAWISACRRNSSSLARRASCRSCLRRSATTSPTSPTSQYFSNFSISAFERVLSSHGSVCRGEVLYKHMYLDVFTHMHTHIYIYTNICMCAKYSCMCIHTCVYIHVYTYKCVCVCISLSFSVNSYRLIQTFNIGATRCIYLSKRVPEQNLSMLIYWFFARVSTIRIKVGPKAKCIVCGLTT